MESEFDIFSTLFDYSIFNLIGILFSIIAFIIIFNSSIKLSLTCNIPGTKLIFYSMVTLLSCIVIYLFYVSLQDDANQYIIEAIIISLESAAMIIGAYGYKKLVKFIINEHANNN